MKQSLKAYVAKYPRLYKFLKGQKSIIKEFIKPGPMDTASFEGWFGMSLMTAPPWDNILDSDNLASIFLDIDKKLIKQVKNGDFRLTQFEQYKFYDIDKTLTELKWRHFIVFWTAYYSILSTKSNSHNLVEAGVADGLTIYYAINAVRSIGVNYTAFLYDAWEGVEIDNPSTFGKSIQFEFLNIDVTRNNLIDYKNNILYKKGYIPATLTGEDEPSSISWLSIDLNSMQPSIDFLDYYWDRILAGGVVLFDDYAQPAYIDTKKAIDRWVIENKNALILQLPTSQAILFKVE
jgi:O-methyltransferase